MPVTLYNPEDTSLLGRSATGVNNYLLDTPNYIPGCNLEINQIRRRTASTRVLYPAALGQLGTAPRRFFYGPGIENFDMALIQERAVRRLQGVAVRLECSTFQPSAVLRPKCREREHCQPAVWPVQAAAAPRENPARAKFSF